jgi:PBSX family phage terminase large subunit
MLTSKQKTLITYIINHNNTLAYGGARSGKTYGIIDCIVTLSLFFPNTKHLCARRYEVDIRGSIWGETIKKVMRDKGLILGQDYTTTERPMEVTFKNGSSIVVAGLDDKERVDKILGTEYSTIYLNESQDIPWPTVKTLSTRLAQKGIDRRRFIFDLNPQSIAHWTYKLFFLHINPETQKELDQSQYAKIQMNPIDNQDNLPEDYIRDKLEVLTGSERARFYLGEYQTDTDIKVFSPTSFYEWGEVDLSGFKLVGGLDLGYNDADAFCILAYKPGLKDIYLVYEHKARRQNLEQLAEAIRRGLGWADQYINKNVKGDMDIFADTATIRHGKEGDSKKTASMLSYTYGLPVRPAHKRDKKMMIEYLQNAINGGWFHCMRVGHWAQEMESTVWRRLTDGTIERNIDDEVFHPDMMDAILYALKFIISDNETLQTISNNVINKQSFGYYEMMETLNDSREVW